MKHLTIEDRIKALIADEAKQKPMLEELARTLRQLQAKNAFRIALLNQLREELESKGH